MRAGTMDKYRKVKAMVAIGKPVDKACRDLKMGIATYYIAQKADEFQRRSKDLSNQTTETTGNDKPVMMVICAASQIKQVMDNLNT